MAVSGAFTVHPAVLPSKTTSPERLHSEVDVDPGSPLYFQILQGPNSFIMMSAATAPDKSCSGPDLMHSRL